MLLTINNSKKQHFPHTYTWNMVNLLTLLQAPPKYEYKYAVHDHHTGDLKEKVEERIGDLTKTQYAWGEKDREVKEARVIAHSVPVKIIGKY